MTKPELPRMPESFLSDYVTVFNKGIVDHLVEMYEENAVFHLQDGTLASGIAEIRTNLLPFLSLKIPMRIVDGFCVVAGDYALVSSHWYIDGSTSDGSPVKIDGKNCDLIHRGRDGFWRLVIENPFGTAVTP